MKSHRISNGCFFLNIEEKDCIKDDKQEAFIIPYDNTIRYIKNVSQLVCKIKKEILFFNNKILYNDI